MSPREMSNNVPGDEDRPRRIESGTLKPSRKGARFVNPLHEHTARFINAI